MAIFLVLPDQSASEPLPLNRTAEPNPTVPFLKDKQLNLGVLVLQYLLWRVLALMIAFSVCYAPHQHPGNGRSSLARHLVCRTFRVE